MEIKPIRTKANYRAALKDIESLMAAKANTPEGDRLDVLTTLVEAYEESHFPMDIPDPIDAIKFRLEQRDQDTKALIGIIGNRPGVYEFLRRDRSLSLAMIRQLSEHLRIPAEILIRPV